MTPPVRPSQNNVAVKIVESIGSTLTRLVAGIMLFGPGLYWLVDELKNQAPGESVHKWHIGSAVGLMVLGALSVNPPFGKQISSLIITIFPNGVPLIGGRRSTDIPAQPTDEVKKP